MSGGKKVAVREESFLGTEDLSSKARVKKYRATLKAKGCRRLEVIVHSSVIEGMREIAKREKMTMWQAVHDAFVAYSTGRAACDDRPEPV